MVKPGARNPDSPGAAVQISGSRFEASISRPKLPGTYAFFFPKKQVHGRAPPAERDLGRDKVPRTLQTSDRVSPALQAAVKPSQCAAPPAVKKKQLVSWLAN